MAETEDRTEAASPRRLQRAREDGQVPISRDATAAGVLAVATLVMAMDGPALTRRLAEGLVPFLDRPDDLAAGPALREALGVAAMAAAPFVLGALFAGTASVLLQTGFLLRPAALLPDFSRLDPRRGLARVFGVHGLVEAGKSLLKLAAAAIGVWYVGQQVWPILPLALRWNPAGLMDGLAAQVARMAVAMLAAQIVVAGIDVVQARVQHLRGLRMSRQELRDEHREAEGDPAIKARIRRLRRDRARLRIAAAVPKATVVVTNPTHFAVALAYERGQTAAPRLVAKGADEMAVRIREIAREAGVPVVANPPLARALYPLPLEAEIPVEHFKAVAEVIAYVWRLKGELARMRPRIAPSAAARPAA